MLDINFKTSQHPKAGSILLAEPFANDEYFRRSVVLLCEHNTEGSFGFVLNNYIDLPLDQIAEGGVAVKSKVSIGGPVDTNSLYYIHRFGKLVPNSVPIARGLFLGGDFKSLMDLLKNSPMPEKQARFFLGYSGWSKNQLQSELGNQYWAVVKKWSNDWLIDTEHGDMWKECLNRLGGKYKMFTHFPLNPNNN